MQIWHPGEPAPERPRRGDAPSEAVYTRDLERYADNLERMLIFITQEHARFPDRLKAAMQRIGAARP